MTESTSLDEMLKVHKQELDLLSSKNVEKWDDLLTYGEEPKNERIWPDGGSTTIK